MAKIKFGMFMTDARGKVGGQVFSKNRGGAYVRTKVTPSNPRTAKQMASRAILGQLSVGWSALTSPQIQAWNKAVNDWQKTDIFGDLKSPTGKNLFVALNKNLLQSRQTSLNVPPAKQDLQDLSQMTVAVNVSTSAITITGLPVLSAGMYQVWATPAINKGVSFYKNKLRVLDYVSTFASAGEGLFDTYAQTFGALKAGDNLFIQVRVIGDNGQAGVPFAVRVVAV